MRILKMRYFFIGGVIFFCGLSFPYTIHAAMISRLTLPINSNTSLVIQKDTNGVEKKNIIISDYLSSTRTILAEDGTIINTPSYYPYGDIVKGRTLDESDSRVRPSTDRFYTGQRKVTEGSNIYNYNARYYNPDIAMFTQPDTVEGINRYAYVGGNPVMKNDPSGNTGTIINPYDFAFKTDLADLIFGYTTYLAKRYKASHLVGQRGITGANLMATKTFEQEKKLITMATNAKIVGEEGVGDVYVSNTLPMKASHVLAFFDQSTNEIFFNKYLIEAKLKDQKPDSFFQLLQAEQERILYNEELDVLKHEGVHALVNYNGGLSRLPIDPFLYRTESLANSAKQFLHQKYSTSLYKFIYKYHIYSQPTLLKSSYILGLPAWVSTNVASDLFDIATAGYDAILSKHNIKQKKQAQPAMPIIFQKSNDRYQ